MQHSQKPPRFLSLFFFRPWTFSSLREAFTPLISANWRENKIQMIKLCPPLEMSGQNGDTDSGWRAKCGKTAPVRPWFGYWSIFFPETKGTIGRKGLQVDLWHFWHCEVNWTIMPAEVKERRLHVNVFEESNHRLDRHSPASIFHFNKRLTDPASCDK